jgi:hypothetical protein
MQSKEEKDIIPGNKAGKAVDLDTERVFDSPQRAATVYRQVRESLLHPPTWQRLAAQGSASFHKDGEEHAPLKEGDYVKIRIPGPAPQTGEGFDWVQVDRIDDRVIAGTDESFVLTLKVCANPENPNAGIAHFFARDASSTFLLERKGEKLKLSYRGRNEKPNLEIPKLGDKIRNLVVSAGALAGISELQWKSLLEGLLAEVN